ncbi:unnamed protein product [Diamesa serratosioi]
MLSCCTKFSCCAALKPRYKRLVDNIFPANPEEGLVKSNMEKLTFYSLSSPEKLDRIGEYLYQKATYDISRRRYKLVEIAMEAMDLLLMACHAQTLNLFVESFLRMVQKLMEDSNPNLQIMATNSFVKFANIEEDTPSYHRRYDFFISKFSSMCHGSNDDAELRNNIRMAGIKGLQGVIRKTVSDDLVENIWEKQHMEKIVPSLLFNMQTGGARETVQDEEEEPSSTPPLLAEAVLRELVSRASFGHIKDVLKPLLMHLDHHQLWVPHEFAIHTFRIVMLSIQPQYSYTVVETLMSHLDQSTSAKTKTSLAVVLSKIIAIAAGESVGPSALDIINNLLTLLRDSVSSKTPIMGQYQENLINALGQFANHHPDYQKIEIMLFIMNKVPDQSKKSKVDQLLQVILLKSLLKVSVQYRTVSFDKAFPASFLQPLLKMAKVSHVDTRITVMEILQALLDRHQNQNILGVISIKNYQGLTLESPSRSDIIFANKQVGNLMQALIESMIMDDHQNALESAYTTAALMIAEMACIDTLQEFLLFIFSLQTTALRHVDLTPKHKCNLHRIVISLTALLGRCVGVYSEYCEKLIERRRAEAPYLLPPLMNDDDSPTLQSLNMEFPEELLLNRQALVECLQSAGIGFNRLQMDTPNALFQSERRISLIDGTTLRDGMSADLTFDIDSVNSSPDVQRRPLVNVQELNLLELNFEGMKRILTNPTEPLRQEEENKSKQEQMAKNLKEKDFDELMKHTECNHDHIQNKLNELFNSLANDRPFNAVDPTAIIGKGQKPIYEKNFPELFFF